MSVDKLARKLYPLFPDQIQRLLHARDTADADLKSLIEKQIVHLAQKTFGDYRSKILLSLPPQKKSSGEIHFGTIVYDKEYWPFGISKSELLQNVLILGRSGAGKTNVAFHLLEQLIEKKIPFLFLDWKRTARHLLPLVKKPLQIYTPGRALSPFPFNPFIVPPGLEARVYINHLVDVMAEAYTLGDGARSILQKALSVCYSQNNQTPSVKDVFNAVKAIPNKERVSGWKITAIRALESLDFAELTATDSNAQRRMAENILKQNTIIELDALSVNGKKFLIPMLCLWLYYVQLSSEKREQLQLAVFLEEAHHVLYRQEQRVKESVMNMLLRQCREIGMALIVIDQHPHLLSSAALGNCYTSICLNQKNPSDINKAAALSLVDADEKHFFSLLPVGQGIVKLQDRWRHPFLVQFPLMHFQKGAITDELVARYIRKNIGSESKIARIIFSKLNNAEQEHKPISNSGLDDEELAFIQDVLEHPADGVKQRYQRLQYSIGRGNRVKEQLLKSGWLNSEIVELVNTRKVLLRLSPKAQDTVGLSQSATLSHLTQRTKPLRADNNIDLSNQTPRFSNNASLVHEYWKSFYMKKFQEAGYRVIPEAPRKGGRVDLLAIKDGMKIGIEIETGKSDVVSNVRSELLSGFQQIIVVATSKTALEKINTQLAKARLIIPQRIRLVLKDEFQFESIE